MRDNLKWALALALPLMASPVWAAKKPVPAKAEAAAKAPVQVAATELELVHRFPKVQADVLQALVDKFNAQNPGANLILSNRDWQSGALPLMMVLERDAAPVHGKPGFKPLWQVMKDAGQPLEAGKAPLQMSPTALDAAGKLQALPVGLSTPVMFYNKDLFRKVGLNPDAPPKDWFELQKTLGTLATNKVACPYVSSWSGWVHVDNTVAWHNEPFAAPKELGLMVNKLLAVKHLAMMTTWVKARYMHGFGHHDEGDAHFASGECAVVTTTASSYPAFLQQAKFEIGVAPLPYHDDYQGAPQNTLADGPSLWVGAGFKPQAYQVAAKFVRFMLNPENQAEWQGKAGFLALDKTGLPTLNVDAALADANRIALGQLKNKPATEASRATRLGDRHEIRELLDRKLDEVWSNQKAAKQVMDEAVEESKPSKGKLVKG